MAGALEALLLLAAEPVTEFELAQAVGVPESVVAETLTELVAFYAETGRGFELREVGGGWRYYTREEYADLITRYVLRGSSPSCPRPRWRRWRWSPTPSRSRERGCRRYGASTSMV